MSEMLSQEEIDALLRGDSTPAAQDIPSFDDHQELSEEEIDALGEIGNISMGTSATTLFTLLNNKVNITTPKVSISTWAQLSAEYTAPYVAVQVQYTDGLMGTNLLILKERDVRIITDLMMGGDGTDNGEEIGELHLSAIGEAMNQMIGSSSTSLATMFTKRIDISPPRAFVMTFEDNNRIDGMDPGDKVVKIAFRMEIGDVIDSEIMQLLPIDFAKDLVSNLFKSMNGPSPTPEPPKPAAKPAPPPPPPPRPEPVRSAPLMDEYDAPPPRQAPEPRRREEPQRREEPKVVNVQPIQYQSFENDQWSNERESIDLIMDVPLEITVELGRTKKLIKDILEFGPGTILELDKLAGEPVDILVNGKHIAKGEVVVIDESFGVRITDIISSSKRVTNFQ